MQWEEALEAVMALTGHVPFRTHCDESDPNHQAWRAEMIRKAASGELADSRAQVDRIIADALARPHPAVVPGKPCGKC
jgi:hypothetical protein